MQLSVCLLLLLITGRVTSFSSSPKTLLKLSSHLSSSSTVTWSSLHHHPHDFSIAVAVSATDAERFAPQADPVISLVSGGILFGFFVVQSRVNKANELIRIIKEKKEALQKVKASMLSTDDPEQALSGRNELQAEIKSLEEDLLNAMTFLDIPNGPTMRFRIAQASDMVLDEQQRREIDLEKIKDAVKDMSSESTSSSGASEDEKRRDDVTFIAFTL